MNPPDQRTALINALRTTLCNFQLSPDFKPHNKSLVDALADRAEEVLASHPQQPSAGQGEAYELLQAWGALYNTPPLVVGEEWEAMFKSVFAATCKFLARPIPPPPPATGEPPAKEGETAAASAVVGLTLELEEMRGELVTAKAELDRIEPDYNVYAKIQDDNVKLRARLAQLEAAQGGEPKP